MSQMQPEEFFEPDEPVEDVIRAFARGRKGRTHMPGSAALTSDARSMTYSAPVWPDLKVLGLPGGVHVSDRVSETV